jgi:Arc/MetJ-type ribon-helix-helix transcriptional regulator
MIRTQIQLTERQARELRRIAAAEGVSVAAVIRRAVDRVVDQRGEDAAWRRALTAVGSIHGDGANVARDHDKYLDEAYRS